LLCDGSAVSRTGTYAGLFAAIGTTYGAGDGSTTFNLPNAQGVFLRGAGSQTIGGITYNGTQGTTEGDQMQGHVHSFGNDRNDPWTNDSSIAGAQTGPSAYTALGVNFVSSPISDGTNGTPRTGSETRPANIAVKYIIKY
jgi:microcystin-dependent protein